MIKDRIVYVNGEYVPWQNATVHIMCHSFGRGSAIFEVISLHATGSGTAIFRLQAHIDRLFKSAELLDMELPMTKENFYEAVAETVKRNGLQKGYLKIICFYPEFSIDILPPQKQLTVSIFAIDAEQDLGKKPIPFETGTTLFVSSWRKLDPTTVPIEAKAAANYLNGMVARMEAQKKGFEYAVMLDTEGYIAEGGTESIFLVKDNHLMTPATGTVLKSISRMSILEAAKTAGIKSFEDKLKPELLFEAEEIFLSCTPFKVLPVCKINERQLAQTPGPLTRQIAELLNGIAGGNKERFKDWMYPVA
ncbi:MAG: branched-chain-amino-acid transaminase [Deltaproteobacteria bacterium]|nr:branched-chain-amino-acid transaminase [Deltaproteobacteria bacterium]